MKVEISYEVQSKTVLHKDTRVVLGDRAYTFHVDQSGILTKITITADVKDPTKFYSKVTLTPDQFSKATFELRTDEELHDSIIKDFQDLESLLSFSYNVKRFDWNSRKYSLICETEEEKANANIFSMNHWREFPDHAVSVTEEQLKDTLSRKDRLSCLTIFFSFFREGKNEYHDLKFINAFYQFYFVLEGMYGKRKTKNRSVTEEFKRSSELRDFVQNMIDEHILISPEHRKQLNGMLIHRNMTLGVDSILELIVKTRGELHHFTNNPNKGFQATPFNHEDFRTISFIVMGLSLLGILARVVEINQGCKASDNKRPD